VKNNPFILASASPRRKELLAQAGITPDLIISTDIDETPRFREAPRDMVLRLASEKARALMADYPRSFILAADTTVAVGRRILGKPVDETEARAFLELLSGRAHRVYGGIALATPMGKIITRCVETRVQFKRLTSSDITTYIESKEWDGKAGGYGIQGVAAAYVRALHGSYTNVVGLSLYDTVSLLRGVGFLKD
jgi:septum formation protein